MKKEIQIRNNSGNSCCDLSWQNIADKLEQFPVWKNREITSIAYDENGITVKFKDKQHF